MTPIVLIVGMFRAGTSWVWEMLTAHPDAIALTPRMVYPDHPTRWNTMETGMFDRLSDGEVRQVIARHTSPGKVLIEKTPHHVNSLAHVWELFPLTRVIAMERDHKEVRASSFKRWGTRPADLNPVIADRQRAIDRIRDDPRVVVVDYNGLRKHLRPTLEAMCQHVGLNPSGAETILSEPRIAYLSEGSAAA